MTDTQAKNITIQRLFESRISLCPLCHRLPLLMHVPKIVYDGGEQYADSFKYHCCGITGYGHTSRRSAAWSWDLAAAYHAARVANT